MVVASQRQTEENKKLRQKILKLTSDHSEEVERQMMEYGVAVKQATTNVAMMATSKSRKFCNATNRPAFKAGAHYPYDLFNDALQSVLRRRSTKRSFTPGVV